MAMYSSQSRNYVCVERNCIGGARKKWGAKSCGRPYGWKFMRRRTSRKDGSERYTKGRAIGWEGSQSALSQSTCDAPTVNVLKDGSLFDQTLVESNGEQGSSAGNKSDSGLLKAHTTSRRQRAREF